MLNGKQIARKPVYSKHKCIETFLLHLKIVQKNWKVLVFYLNIYRFRLTMYSINFSLKYKQLETTNPLVLFWCIIQHQLYNLIYIYIYNPGQFFFARVLKRIIQSCC